LYGIDYVTHDLGLYALKSISFRLTLLLLLLLSRNKCRNGNDKITESFISTTVRDTGNKQVKKEKNTTDFERGKTLLEYGVPKELVVWFIQHIS
jgi:hypothetical protein